MKTVLFGGAFDPPHRGHQAALRAILDILRPDRVLVLPSGTAPHKALSGGADAPCRMELCRAAFLPLGEPVEISDFDLKQEGACYTYLTLRHFREEASDGDFYLYMGTDQFLSFEKWKNFREILENATLCVMSRDGDAAVLEAKKAQLEQDFAAQILLLQEKTVIISSTQVRDEVAKDGFSPYLCPSVNDVIARHGCYGSRLNQRRGAVLDRIFDRLDDERLHHTLSVEREVTALCRLLGLEEREEELRLAALLHDLTRRLTEEEQLKLMRELGEEVTRDDLASPAVLHGRSAAHLAARDFGLDESACNAIRYHTVGRAGMTVEEAILNLADYIEETRSHAACLAARKQFYEGLPQGREARLHWLWKNSLLAMEGSRRHLEETHRPVHPQGKEAEAYLKKMLKGNTMTPIEKAERIAHILDDKKGRDIKILKVTDQTVICDYFVICGGGSNTQVKALSDEVEFKLREEDGILPERIEGYNDAAWVLLDYADVIVHLFDPQSREFYKLEKLWAEAEEVPFAARED